MPLTFVSVIGDDASHYNVSSSPTPLASTSSAALSTLVILLTTTLAILWYRHHHAHRRWRRAGAAEEDDRQYLRAETTTSMTTSTSPLKQTETMTTPSTNPAIKKEVADDAMTTMVELKLDFLSRYKGQYGYANSKKGNIDNWRNDEFPSLIPPLKVQPSSLDRQRDELPSTLQSPSSLQINHDDDELYQRKIVPNNVKSDTDGDEDSTDTIDKEVYLDSTGSALPSKSLLHQIYMHEQQYQILANPHSYGGGRASDRTMKLMRKAEECVLRHFGTLDVSEDENAEKSGDIAVDSDRKAEEGVTTASSFNPGYRVIFTSGATDSLRLVAERFPWSYAQFTADSSSCSSSSTSQRFCMTLIDEGGHAVSNGAIDTASPPPPPPSLSPTLSNRVKSIRLSSILLYPTNVHTSVIGMRQIALQHGGQFHCVSVEELLGATADWFQDLLRRSVAYDYWNDVDDDLQQKKDVDEDHDEWIAEDMPNLTQVGSNEDAMETKGAIPCKTIWLHHLLVLPLECNFGGDRFDWSKTTAMARKSCVTSHYLHWTNNMRQEGKESKTMIIRHKWHILLDTAKAAATSPVHLPTLAHGGGPDFAVVSFYKLFGTPTGLGALLIKRQHRRRRKNSRIHRGNWKDESMDNPVDAMIGVAVSDITSTRQVVNDGIIMERNISPRYYFGGGSVDVVLPEKDFVSSRNAYVTLSNNQVMLHHEPDGDEHVDLGVLTHGTQNFRGIAQLIHGFQEIDDYGGMEKISMHSTCLATELVRRFEEIIHFNGKHVVEVYGWSSMSKSFDVGHGPTVAFNILGSDGSPVGCDEVSKLATINSPPIQLRTGCFCNPGACQSAIKLSSTDVLNNYWFGNVVCGDQRGIVNGKPTGAIRASFGKDSTWEDMDALVRFVAKVFVSRTDESHPRQSPPEEDSALHQTITMQIDSLFVFPIKSCAAMRVNRWPIDRVTGRLAFDREFALVDTSGSAMRLHSYPQMSQIHAKIDLESRTLTITSPNHKDLVLDLDIANSSTISPEDIQVCGTLCKGNIWGGCKASKWFSSVLGVRCWLARHHDVEKDAESSDDNKGHAYCNEASMLVLSQQSISILNSVITAQGTGRLVESRHFRPNIVVSRFDEGIDSGEDRDGHFQMSTNPEDTWQQITIHGATDDVELNAVGKCARCQMVDIDPSSGMRGNTLRALAQYRRDRGRINFGTFFTGNRSAPKGDVWIEEGNNVHTSSCKIKVDS